MQDLQEAIVKSFNHKIQSGEIDRQISDRLAKFTDSVLSDVLASYGDFSKALKDKVQSQLIAGIDQFSLQSYNDVIIQHIKKKVDETYVTDAKKHLAQRLDKLFRKPSITKFSQLFAEYKDLYEDEAREEQHEYATLHIDDRDHIIFISMDYRSDKKDYECDYRITMDREGHLISASKRREIYSRSSFEKKHEYEVISAKLDRWDTFEAMLFQLQSYAHLLEKDFDEAEGETGHAWYRD